MGNEERLRDYLKLVTAELQQTRRQLHQTQSQRHEPIAIIGMSCRFPGGVSTPEELWALLAAGVDATSEFPADRGWQVPVCDPGAVVPGATYVTRGGFLAEAGQFDAGFFGIGPREAATIDPQQRLLLEISWEAFERAGIPVPELRGSQTGVFTGVIAQEYAHRMHEADEETSGHLLTGSATSVASGRISYTLGLEGPAVTVDTACSSSLVAIQLAVQALRNRECGLALAGGATVICAPGIFTEFSKQRGLSPDGRCKAFAAAADGTGFAEGAGVVLLERLTDAQHLGHPVEAVIRGIAVNQDGASNGLSAPSGPAQMRVIERALADAGLEPGDVDAVEAHGTGTTLGDPIEANALLATYGRGRAAGQPVLLGSIKSNIGHTQAAAGVAGLIKMVLAMRNGLLPATLHVDRPTPHVDWAGAGAELLAGPRPWDGQQPGTGRPRRAAISSFGISGTNAHCVIEEPARPDEPESAPAAPGALPFILSAKGEPALRAQAGRIRQFVAGAPGLPVASLACSLATTRTMLADQAVILADGRPALLERLAALEAGAPTPDTVTGRAAEPGKVAFVFPGQGAQWAGMAAELDRSACVFREALDRCADAIEPHTDWRLRDVLRGEPGAPGLDRADVVQPVLFAVMVALAGQWRAAGVQPDAVLGHSQGEIAAACVAGALTLEDAARVVVTRSRLLAGIAGTGGMVSVSATPARTAALTLGWPGQLSVAAVNGPEHTVVSGPAAALGEFQERCATEGIQARRIPVDYASHSPQVEAVRAPMLAELRGIAPRPGAIPFCSALTAEPMADTTGLTAEYWYRNLRHSVRFEPAVRALLSTGHTLFIEVSPHPVLTIGAGATIEAAGADAAAIGTLRRDDGGWPGFLRALAQAHLHGAAVDWGKFFGTPQPRRVALPTYPFARQRHWVQARMTANDLTSVGMSAAGHPLLGAAVRLARGGGLLFSGLLDIGRQPWLNDHTVDGTALLPGTAFVDLVIHAGDQAGCGHLSELTIGTPLPVATPGGVRLQVRLAEPDDAGRREVAVYSQPGGSSGDTPWTQHATGLLAPGDGPAPGRLAPWPPPDADPVPLEGAYDRLAADGYGYGPAFQGLRAAWRSGRDTYVAVALPAGTAVPACGLHPALFDAVMHALLLDRPDDSSGQILLPFSWRRVQLHAAQAASLRARISLLTPDRVSVLAVDEAGDPVLTADEIVLRPAARVTASTVWADSARHLYETAWGPLPPAAGTGLTAPGWAMLPSADTSPLFRDGGPPDVALVRCDAAAGSGGEATAAGQVTAWALALVRDWLADSRLASARLAVVTRNAMLVRPGETPPRLAQVCAWGLLRAAQAEHPGRFVLLDLDDPPPPDGVISAALATGEPELAVRDGTIYTPRLQRLGPGSALPVPAEPHWRLETTGRGSLDVFALVPRPELAAPLAPDQVRIAVHAAGVNFRDVMVTLGLVPDDGRFPAAEGAGIVVETGPAAAGLAPGDRVMGLLTEGAGPLTVTSHRLVVKIPGSLTFAQAAGLPVAFLTAGYGLMDLAGLQAGESVLVHAAAGGVGMAAIQLARHLGAEVFATASPAKWGVLRELGLADDHIASSRDLQFGERFGRATGGRGVDVVLNSLTGEFTNASLRLLATGGRFIEMGKADLRDGQAAGPRYHAFDLMDAGTERVQELLAQLATLAGSGALRPLPVTAWDITRAPEAYRHLSHSRHVGKIVLTVREAMDPSGTVLITGGTGTLGGIVARHLVTTHGVRSLLLVSRSGLAAPGAPELMEELTRHGASVGVHACDVADPAALSELLARIPDSHPLTAVVHAAGVLDDATIESLTASRLPAVLRPKVDAAWHLHRLTEHLDLSAFVLFSSAAATFGRPGQASYCAANAFLDGLARFRQARGLPATALAWGLWAQTSGMTGAPGAAPFRELTALGLPPIATEQALAILDAALPSDRPVLVAAVIDQERLAHRMASGDAQAVPPLLRGFAQGPTRRTARTGPAAGTPSLRAVLATLPAAEQRDRLSELTRTEVAAVLGHATADVVGDSRPFREAGLDSLGSVELRNRLSAATGLRLPASLAFDYPTPAALAEYLRTQLLGGEAAPDGTHAIAPPCAAEDPIAIVGLGCRYPGGVRSADDLWRLAEDKVDAIGEFPTDRGWDLGALYDPDPEAVGTSYARHGGFLADAAGFDAGFFGISPREAAAIDPQQRLLLEVAWQTIEDAGIDPGTLRGSATGTFAGVIAQQYATGLGQTPGDAGGYLLTGTTTSVASGRIAYSLGLEGPAVTVDTACSSSLVALHLAVQALHAGDCSMALAGGATVIATPGIFIEFSKQRGLAPDGRCKSFAAAADGTGFAEGVGLVLLERLSDARRLNHRVLAVIRGIAVNQDGTSNGLTAPNGSAQERVIGAALARAGLGPGEVDAVEAHGTGTVLGDPIEANALRAAYGRHRQPDVPLYVGSVKSNIGHTQAAAGIAGVIKMVGALRSGVLPATLHAAEPSPHVEWDGSGLRLLTEPQAWPQTGRPRRAAVSAFGISGTNAHAILEESPPVPARPAAGPGPGGPPAPLLLSAATGQAGQDQARLLAGHLRAHPGLTLAAAARTLAAGRTALAHRAVVIGTGRDEILAGLDAAAAGNAAPGLVTGPLPTQPGKIAYVLPGQGAQFAGMGRDLAALYQPFAAALTEVAGHFEAHLDQSLLDVMFAADGTPQAALLDQTRYTQPALFAVHTAFGRLLADHGLAPDMLIGHSIGEISAAHLAGVLSLADACTLVAARARLMHRARGDGAMMAIQATEAEVRDSLAARGQGGRAEIAAVNGPASTVVSGDEAAVLAIGEHWRARGRRVSRLRVARAFHSHHMDGVLAEFSQAAEGVRANPPGIPVVSNLTGVPVTGEQVQSPEYWAGLARGPVRFHQGIEWLRDHGVTLCLELGPHHLGHPGMTIIPTLRRDVAGPHSYLTALAHAHVAGTGPDWQRLCPGPETARLPTYPFQHRPYWLRGLPGQATPAGLGQRQGGHPLLAAAISLASQDGEPARTVHTGRLAHDNHAWLAGHSIGGVPVLPAAALLDLARYVGSQSGHGHIHELTLHDPLTLPHGAACDIQVVDTLAPGGEHTVAVCSRSAGAKPEEPWTRNATAGLTEDTLEEDSLPPRWPPPGATRIDVAGFYPGLARQGYQYGPAFQGLRAVWRKGDSLYADVAIASEHAAPAGFGIQPALLDSALHPVFLLFPPGQGRISLPFTLSGVCWHGQPAELRVVMSRTGASTVRVTLAESSGRLVGRIGSLALREVPTHGLGPAAHDTLFRLHWTPVPTPPEPYQGPLATVPADSGPTGLWPAIAGPVVLEIDVAAQEPDVPAAARALTGSTLALVQRWLADERFDGDRLVAVTRGAVATRAGEPVPGLAAAPSWGLLRSVQAEHPGRIVLLDVDGAAPAAVRQAIALDEPVVAVRDGRLMVPRLAPAGLAAGAAGSPLRPDGTVLITGGTGSVGGHLARHLVSKHGLRNLLLAGRGGPDAPGAKDLAAELTGLGAHVTLAACDVADRDALAALLAQIPTGRPLTGIFHLAGTLADATAAQLTTDHLDAVFRPKLDGAWNLHELTGVTPVFILFSSIAGIIATPGQGSYAAGNAFLDALAQQRRAQGLPAVSIAWGPWQTGGTGMAATLDRASQARFRRSGVATLEPGAALAALDLALGYGEAALLSVRLDRPALRDVPPRDLPAMLRGVAGAARPAGQAAVPLRDRLRGATEARAAALLLEEIRGQAAVILGYPDAAAIDPDRPFTELGLDSLTAIELRNHLETAAGLPLTATVAFDYPTAAALAGHLATGLAPGPPAAQNAWLAQIDLLEQQLDVAAADDATRQIVATRLRGLLARWSGDAGGPAGEPTGPRITDASAEEIFDFIDRQLGRGAVHDS